MWFVQKHTMRGNGKNQNIPSQQSAPPGLSPPAQHFILYFQVGACPPLIRISLCISLFLYKCTSSRPPSGSLPDPSNLPWLVFICGHSQTFGGFVSSIQFHSIHWVMLSPTLCQERCSELSGKRLWAHHQRTAKCALWPPWPKLAKKHGCPQPTPAPRIVPRGAALKYKF